MKSLLSLIRTRSNQSPVLRRALASMVLEAADEILSKILGESAKDYAKVAYLKHGALTIACLSSIAAQEIKIHEAEIISFLNNKFGERTVEKIKYLA